VETRTDRLGPCRGYSTIKRMQDSEKVVAVKPKGGNSTVRGGQTLENVRQNKYFYGARRNAGRGGSSRLSEKKRSEGKETDRQKLEGPRKTTRDCAKGWKERDVG